MSVFQRVYETINPSGAVEREKKKLQLDMLKKVDLQNSGYSEGWASRTKNSELDMLKKVDVQNSGYSEGGASRTKNSVKGFRAKSYTPQEDIDLNLDLLRQRSRTLSMISPIAASAIKLNRTNIVGAGLRLRSRIDFKRLGLSQESADKWEREVEREFNLWAESKFCDTTRINDFYEIQSVALVSWLLNGDAFVLIDYDKATSYMPYTFRIKLIEGDRVSTPGSIGSHVDLRKKWDNGNRIFSGVEISDKGAVVAYHICNSYLNTDISHKREWVRVESIGKKTGVPNVLHIMETERPEQYRGVPYLAPVIVTLRQLTQYTEAELMAAVINGIFSVFVTTASGNDDVAFGDSVDESQRAYDENGDYQLGSGMINFLGPGEDIKIADATRPNVNFDGFASAMCKYIGAALEIPYEVLVKNFTASYSASRAALLEVWKYFKMRRSWFVNDFCQPVYEIWLAEAVAIGRIKAPGFFMDPAIKKAWCKAEWSGPAQGHLNPVQEVNAAKIRVAEGFSTRERETIEINGGDFDNNTEHAKMENEKMKECGLKEEQS